MTQLNDNKEVYKLIEQLQEVYWSFDITTKRVRDVSKACQLIFEYTAEELIKDATLWQRIVIDEEVHQFCLDSVTELQEKPFSIDYRVRTKSGKEKWIRSRMMPVFDENQQLISIDGVLTDITKEKVAAINLLNYETLLTAVSDANQELLVTTNMAEAIERALKSVVTNTKCHSLAVFSVSNQARRIRAYLENDWFPLDQGNNICALDQEYIITHIVSNNMYYERLKYGESILLTKGDFPQHLFAIIEEVNIDSIFLIPIIINEDFWGCLGVYCQKKGYEWSDMERQVLAAFASSIGHSILRNEMLEELIESRTYLEAILNSGETGIFSVNRSFEVVMYNRKMSDIISNFTNLIIRKNHTVKHIFSDLGLNEMKDHIASSFNGESHVVDLMFESNGVEWYECSFSPIYGEEENVRDVLITLRNVTERKQNEALLLDAKREAEQVNQAKSDFLSSMSHELRTPLNAILGFSQLLEIDQMDPLTENQQENLQEILKAGHHLLNLVKPVEQRRLQVAIEKVRRLIEIDNVLSIQQSGERQLKLGCVDKLIVRFDRSIYFIPYKDIFFIEKVERKSVIHTKEKVYETYENLNVLEERLPSIFIQTHRSYLVNFQHVSHIRHSGETYLIYFYGYDKPAYISRNKMSTVQKYIALK
ncbi:LytTR family transcriptional regulator DNA-binding domain-containing protein [Halalkalibacter nanhaiisediminis]|uniref:histidine kinase n=1 Tax=Halalkalibacter nanhaiisediminis TaxID=688079 RepID=A0A562QKD6_9BACI|nr:LytTR family transcriptional regulator DNA-binding domain-containing protein [Halalkalibacter nanhaiisediminis]TWI57165.1 PAS domain S-box-containing protein [Halalkalibacter nanhaiisediminis]